MCIISPVRVCVGFRQGGGTRVELAPPHPRKRRGGNKYYVCLYIKK